MTVLLWHWGNESSAASKFSFELTNELTGRLPLILSSARGSELSQRAQSLPITTHQVSTFSGEKTTLRGKASAALGILRLPLLTGHFRSLLTRHRVDVAVCTFQSIWDLATLPALAWSSTRFILILHDASFHPGDGYLLREHALRQQVRMTDGIMVLSDHVGQQARSAFDYPTDRIWKMPHGVFRFEADIQPARHPRGTRPLRLLFFGRIVAYKGLDRLLAAYRLLRRQVEIELTIAGAGDMQSYKLDDLYGVTVHNRWLTEAEIAKVMRESDVIVLPYIEASQSGVTAAAYGSGRPVVVYPIGGLPEQVVPEQTGLVARDMSIEALADAISELVMRPDLLDRCADGALTYAQHHLGWSACADQVIAAIEAVRRGPRRARKGVV